MFEAIQHFEESIGLLSREIMVISGIIAVLTGLFLWLGGSLSRRLALGMVGSVLGAIIGLVFMRMNLVLILACGAGVSGMLLWRFSAALLSGIIAVFLGFIMTGLWQGYNTDFPADSIAADSIAERPVDILKNKWEILIRQIQTLCESVPQKIWMILAGVFAVVSFLSLVWARIGVSLCCAMAGVLVICAGMGLLLIFKGALPLQWICLNLRSFLTVYWIMVGFGALVQVFVYTDKPKPYYIDIDRKHRSYRKKHRTKWSD